jgi:hypothetical protein
MPFPRSGFKLLSTAALVLGTLSAGSAWAGCSSLKTGDYFVVIPGAQQPWRTQRVSIDVASMTWDDHQGHVMALSSGGAKCAYNLADEETWTLYVSAQSVLAGRTPSGLWMVAAPAKSVKLKSLVGTWNFMHNGLEGGLNRTVNGLMTIASTGKVSISTCGNGTKGATCGKATNMGKLIADADGGFTATSSDNVKHKFYATVNKQGNQMLLATDMTDTYGGLGVAAPQSAITPASVGDTWATWDFDVLGNTLSGGVSTSTITIQAVNADTGAVTRKRTEDCRIDVWNVNNGRDGVQYRPAAKYTKCDGTTGSFGDRLSLGLRTLWGFNVAGWTSSSGSSDSFGLTVIRP